MEKLQRKKRIWYKNVEHSNVQWNNSMWCKSIKDENRKMQARKRFTFDIKLYKFMIWFDYILSKSSKIADFVQSGRKFQEVIF